MTKKPPRSATDRARPRHWILTISVLVVLAILAGRRLMAPHPSVPEPVVASVVVLPAPSEPVPAPAPATPAPVAAPPTLAPLTSVEVTPRPIREVPPEKNPPPPDSTSLDMTRPPPGAAGQRPSEGSTRPAPKQFLGAARVTGATSLTVGAIPVQLFGVKPPLPGDRCELAGTPTNCVELAKRRLQERFGRSDQVNCRTPNPQPGLVVAFAICLDANGIDLGSFLLNEGLALADTGQSYDYVGAEGVARTLKHGLWKFR
jgi:endonuclease YncB( thermonuclease family)